MENRLFLWYLGRRNSGSSHFTRHLGKGGYLTVAEVSKASQKGHKELPCIQLNPSPIKYLWCALSTNLQYDLFVLQHSHKAPLLTCYRAMFIGKISKALSKAGPWGSSHSFMHWNHSIRVQQMCRGKEMGKGPKDPSFLRTTFRYLIMGCLNTHKNLGKSINIHFQCRI